MRLLAVSDIHGNVEAVRMLRERERNRFDAVVVAGDIGGKAAIGIMAILATFACPVLYVFGNWDRDLDYDLSFGPTCHHLHLRSVECGGWVFAGFSGLPAGWGQNPIAAALRHEMESRHGLVPPDKADLSGDLRRVSNDAQRLNRQELAAVIKGSRAGPGRTIVVTHERLSRVERDLPGVPLFLFGHRHGFQSMTFRGAKFVNVSVLDNPVTVRPATRTRCTSKDLRNVNLGSYTIIEIDSDRFDARSVGFAPKFDGWTRDAGRTVVGLPWLREDDLSPRA
jgi:predicted phosphodiesterase